MQGIRIRYTSDHQGSQKSPAIKDGEEGRIGEGKVPYRPEVQHGVRVGCVGGHAEPEVQGFGDEMPLLLLLLFRYTIGRGFYFSGGNHSLKILFDCSRVF